MEFIILCKTIYEPIIRYKLILLIPLFSCAVDYNRVILEPEEGVPDSDYINASYVDVSWNKLLKQSFHT